MALSLSLFQSFRVLCVFFSPSRLAWCHGTPRWPARPLGWEPAFTFMDFICTMAGNEEYVESECQGSKWSKGSEPLKCLRITIFKGIVFVGTHWLWVLTSLARCKPRNLDVGSWARRESRCGDDGSYVQSIQCLRSRSKKPPAFAGFLCNGVAGWSLPGWTNDHPRDFPKKNDWLLVRKSAYGVICGNQKEAWPPRCWAGWWELPLPAMWRLPWPPLWLACCVGW